MISHEMKIWDGVFRGEISREYRISLCTTCMGRLYDLKKTLPANIKHNRAYPNVEFVVLDYNSKDGLGEWMRENMMAHIESGRVAYYRTEEPTSFSMAHSRNIAFKVASGDIVNNVDADNYTMNKEAGVPEECFAARLNRFANDCPEKVIFAKGRRSMHGRIGFYKKEFIELLGGYNEDLEGYGHDDHDLVRRAWRLGFTMYWWGGQYCWRIKTSRKEKNANMKRHWKATEIENKVKSAASLAAGRYKANEGKHWGKAILIKNFETVVEV
jgi:glycosyltransferase involved in cell wall biosynthesis